MAKRFTDTKKWNKVWFRKLDPVNKCFWQYICDTCDHAGIWEVDFELAGFIIGIELDIPEVKKVFNKQFVELKNGKKWFLKDYIDFQYGKLNPLNRVHKSVIDILKKEGAWKYLMSPLLETSKPLGSPLQGPKDKAKDKTKDKVEEKDEAKEDGVEGGKNTENKKKVKVIIDFLTKRLSHKERI